VIGSALSAAIAGAVVAATFTTGAIVACRVRILSAAAARAFRASVAVGGGALIAIGVVLSVDSFAYAAATALLILILRPAAPCPAVVRNI